jgi:hypothetical protein
MKESYSFKDLAGGTGPTSREFGTPAPEHVPHARPDALSHVCTPESCPSPGAYYVTCIDSGSFWKMSGPYPTHAAALADVDKVLAIVNKRDPRAWFMSWGTLLMKDGTIEPGACQKAGVLELPE